MLKLIKTLIIVGTVLAVLAGAAIFLLIYWDKLISLAVAAKDLAGTILKSVFPEKLENDNMNDYYDI